MNKKLSMILSKKHKMFRSSQSPDVISNNIKEMSKKNPKTKFIYDLMVFGFQCQDGWFDLLDVLATEIEKVDKDAKADEVKEKFGELEVYLRYYNDETERLTNNATKLSNHICEVCGRKGSLREVRHWYATLCDYHYKMFKDGKDLFKEKLAPKSERVSREYILKKISEKNEQKAKRD